MTEFGDTHVRLGDTEPTKPFSPVEPATPETAHRMVGVDASGTFVVPVEVSSPAEFLLARISEREAWARAADDLDREFPRGDGQPYDYQWVRLSPLSSTFAQGAPSPGDVLAECVAKRRIVERPGWVTDPAYKLGIEYAIRALASVYVDHPDYRAEWAL